jgi:hypothetical protein
LRDNSYIEKYSSTTCILHLQTGRLSGSTRQGFEGIIPGQILNSVVCKSLISEPLGQEFLGEEGGINAA